MNKIYLGLCLVLLIAGSARLRAQQVTYFDTSSISISNHSHVQLVGKADDRYVLLHHVPQRVAELIYLDLQGAYSHKVKLPFIDIRWISRINVGLNEETLSFVMQGQRNDFHYVQSATSNHKGELKTPLTTIDSTNYRTFGNNAYYRIIAAPSRSHIALYRFVTGFSTDQAWFNALLLDDQLQKCGSTLGYPGINTEFETIGNVFLNSKKEFFFTVFDKALNYRLGSEVRLYQTKFDQKPLQPVKIYLKETKPAELLMTWSDDKDQLVMGGVYYDFYRKHINGAMYLFYDPEKRKFDTIVYSALEKRLRKELKKRIHGISLEAALNNMHGRRLYYTRSGVLVLVADMYNNSTFSGPPVRLSKPQKANSPYPTGQVFGYNSIGTVMTPSPPVSTRRNQPTPDNTLLFYDPVEQFSRSQEILTRADGEGGFPELSATQINSLLTANKEMDYKTLLFGLDPQKKALPKSWIRSLYMPETPFTTAVLLPGDSTVSIISYELSPSRQVYLYSQTMSLYGQPVTRRVLSEQRPMLFYWANLWLSDEQRMVTAWRDHATGRLGLAEINW